MVLSKATPKAPGWLLAIIVAAMAPVTGAAVSYGQILVQQERGAAELALAETKTNAEVAMASARQSHDFRMAYFEKAVSGPPEQRTPVLRFLAASSQDPELQSW